MATPRITVLASGRGSNLAALIAAERAGRLGGRITTVVCNRAGAAVLDIASAHGADAVLIEHTAYADREAFDAALAAAVDASHPDLVVLAGFMRVLGAVFVAHYAGRLLNIHPSLLPAYPGLRTHRRALADGVRVHGCTVHFVTPDVDVGPIVAQGVVPVLPDDDETTLAARVLVAEHRLLPAAVGWFCAGRLALDGGRVRVRDAPVSEDQLLSPAIEPR